MPIHDWTKVSAGIFHDFHLAWIAELRRVLNSGLLPPGYYALAEQVARPIVPNVLTLQESFTGQAASSAEPVEEGGLAVATAPPAVSVRDTISEAMLLAARRRHISIRHATGDQIVALIEIVSPGNKEKRSTVEQFVDKAVGALDEGLHLQVLDLLPPGPFDPGGMHGVLWSRLGSQYDPPPGKPLTLASYAAAGTVTCYVEPTAVGAALIDMPLFLTPERYVNVPLEQPYQAAYESVPGRWKRVIEANA
ncbi:MAG TPA: DUF4058 family protein [Tepidisphaeraceae bacterium]|jgi:hypothetical protein|nr:DUF4058 family protein [Tepidisphaeraceae bacterium]